MFYLSRFSLISTGMLLALAGQECLAQNPVSSKVQQYQQMCQQTNGYFQYGMVNAPPESDYDQVTYFKDGASRQGIPISHTHIEITSGLDNQVYDVAIDNVFAADYDPNSREVPPSYATQISAGSSLYFCSGNPEQVPYTVPQDIAKQGFDWVHTNCESPNSKYADGFLFTDSGVNLSNSHQYCYLWP